VGMFRCFVFVIVILLAGCTAMKPSDFADTSPKLDLEAYFLGTTIASGIFEDRFGRVRRQFTVEITGTKDGETLVLDERFLYSDGERDRRVWRIRKIGSDTYEGTAADVIGVAKGLAQGNALNWQYVMDLKVGNSSLRVHFDDWMFLQPTGVMINRARVSKWGIDIGEVTLAFNKPPVEQHSAASGFLQYADEWPTAANQ
jgi:hypothetical protein